MKNIPALIITTLILVSVGMSYIEFRMNLNGEELTTGTWGAWAFIFVVLVGSWVLQDKKSGNFEKPFDFGLTLYLFLPFILLYYLVSTRGTEGIVTYLGFASLYFLPEFMGLVSYAYYY